jgi:hypothetical protein
MVQTRYWQTRYGAKQTWCRIDILTTLCVANSRADLSLAIGTGSRPIFLGEDISWEPYFSRDNAAERKKTAKAASSSKQPGSQCTVAKASCPSSDEKLSNIWSDLQEFAKASNIAFQTNRRLEQAVFQQLMISVHYRLLHLESAHAAHSLEESLRLGMLAFSATIFLQMRGIRLGYQYLASRLEVCFRGMQALDETVALEFELWLLFMSDVSTLIDPLKNSWLLDRLSLTTEKLGLRSWEKTRTVLKAHLWVDRLHDDPGEKLFRYLSQPLLSPTKDLESGTQSGVGEGH